MSIFSNLLLHLDFQMCQEIIPGRTYRHNSWIGLLPSVIHQLIMWFLKLLLLWLIPNCWLKCFHVLWLIMLLRNKCSSSSCLLLVQQELIDGRGIPNILMLVSTVILCLNNLHKKKEILKRDFLCQIILLTKEVFW